MINTSEGSITVNDENGNSFKVYVLFSFEVEELKKRYIAYTLGLDTNDDEVEVLISEMNYDTYEIKSISESEMPLVVQIYNQVKETLLS